MALNGTSPAAVFIGTVTVSENYATKGDLGGNCTGAWSATNMTLTVPTGWIFDTTTTPTLAFTAGMDIIAMSVTSFTSDAITIALTGSGSTHVDAFTITGLKVQPTSMASVSGHITASVVNRMNGIVVNSTNFGTLTVIPASISGASSICLGGSTSVGCTHTSGRWFSSNTSVATVGSVSGVVSGVGLGTTTITYTLSGCSTFKTMSVNVGTSPITGSSTVCAGSTTTLSNTTPGGTWSSSNTSRATIGLTNGVLTGVAAGDLMITYRTVTASCYAVKAFTVNGHAATITGTPTVCVGNTTTLSNTAVGGTWTSDNATVATVGSTSGVVTGIGAGTVTIRYTTGCGSGESRSVTVYGNPSTTATATPNPVCAAGTLSLTATASGGGGTYTYAWSGPGTFSATTGSANRTSVTDGAAGTYSVTVTDSHGCVARATTGAVTVSPRPTSITGTSNVCVGSTTLLNNTVPGGSWASSNSAIVTVGSAGLVSGIAAGTATISYSNSCGTETRTVTVYAIPTLTVSTVPICAGNTLHIYATPGGSSSYTYAWSGPSTYTTTTHNIERATATTAMAGTYSVTVTDNNGCTVSTATSAVINANPTVSANASATGRCAGATLNLSSSPAGGSGSYTYLWTGPATFSASTQNPTRTSATADMSGTYSVTVTDNNGCNITATATSPTIRANPAISATVSPNPAIAGSTITLSSTPSGGSGTYSTYSWSGPASFAATTQNASRTSITTAMAGSYSVTVTDNNGCSATSATSALSVTGVPDAITGTRSICVGATTTLGDATTGGTWSSSNTSIATVSSTGVVTGVVAGTTNISYTLAGGGYAIASVTVNPAPANITGTERPCIGATPTLSDATTGGTWSSSNTSVATISSGGVVTAIAAGNTTISYTTAAGCQVTRAMTVNPLPSVSAGSGVSISSGSSATLVASGGTTYSWSPATTLSCATCGSPVATPTSSTTYTVTGTSTNGCANTASVTVTVTSLQCATAPALEFNVFLENNATFTNNETEGPVAIGGNLTMTGSYQVATNYPGSFIVGGAKIGLVIGGRMYYSGGSSFAVNQSTYVKMGDSTGSHVWYTDMSGTYSPIRITPSTDYNGSPRINLSVSSNDATHLGTGGVSATHNPVFQSALIDFATAFSQMRATATCMSGLSDNASLTNSAGTPIAHSGFPTGYQVKLTLHSGMNVLNLNGSDLSHISDFVYNNTPSSSQYLIVNVNAPGIFNWNVGNSAGSFGGVTGCRYILYNFYNTTTLNIQGGGAVEGTIYAPYADVVKTANAANIEGQVIARSYTHNGGENHYAVFAPCVCGGAPAAAYTVNSNPQCLSGNSFTFTNSSTGSGNTYSWSFGDGTTSTSSAPTHTYTAAGAYTVSLTATNSGGSNTTTQTMTVNPTPTAGTITGATSACAGGTTTLSDATTGGTWNSSNTSVATVSGGVVAGISAGTSVISYSITNSCGAGIATTTITVNPAPASISGTATLSAGSTATLSDATTGGTWTTSNALVATVSSTGIVSGLTGGTAVITYTLPSGCFTTRTITINPLPAVITGTPTICEGSTTSLSDVTTGGTWSSSNPSVATISSTGVVSGISAGISTISYTLSTGAFVTYGVTVNATPSGITGTASACVGATAALSSTTSGGAWATSNSAIASVNASTGIVTGVSAGTAVITYGLSSGCFVTRSVTINATPSAISGSATVNEASTTTFTDGSTGGSWTSSDGTVASVSSTGVVTGVGGGTTVITYTLPAGCYTTKTITVNPRPAAITGIASVCAGSTTTLHDTTTGGTWSSSNTTVATISSTGVLSGVAAGPATITYTLSSGTTATIAVTVNALPASILGLTDICIGSVSALNEISIGGSWSSSDSTIASVDAVTGVATALSPGTTTITYTLVTGCSTTIAFTANANPATIVGSATVNESSTTTFIDSVGGGTWSSSDATVATVSSTGVVSGIAGGIVEISYTMPAGCYTTKTVTVNPLPASITGIATVCEGSTTTLNDATTGGSWSSSNTAIATVSSTGLVNGVSPGTATITYTLSTGTTATRAISVNALPSSITGTTSACVGSTTTLTDATSGGSWSASDATVASINPTSGVVTAVSAGTATVTYTSAAGCSVTTIFTSNANPAAIGGSATVNESSTTTLTDATSGGTWSSSDATVATVSSTGVVTGIAAGTAAITYTLPSGCYTTKTITINPLPAPITGTPTVCEGSTTTLSDATTGGSWSSSNTAVATVSSTGVVNGVSPGTATITYTLSTGTTATTAVTVNALPASIAGTASTCVGSSTTLTNTTSGGSWSSSDPTIASTNATTGVTTAIAVGTATITYTSAAGCSVTTTFTSNANPAAIGGSAILNESSTTTLTDATTGGIWSSSDATVATVSSTGVVTGIAAGTAAITYTLPSGCYTTKTITVNPLPAPITGTPTVCEGSTTTLSDATTGGSWSSSNTTVATVSSSGIVSGLAAGTATITYTLTTGTTATRAVSVNALPSSITGTTSACVGSTTTLTDATSGGSWSTSDATVASINPTSGVVTAVSAGTATVTYTSAAGCVKTTTFTVNANPATITGPSIVNAGSTTTFGDVTTGGAWSTSDATVASVSSTGVITGMAAGTATITYTLPTGCNTTKTITVNASVPPITGTPAVCAGSTTTLSDATTGGTWSSSNTSIASVSSSGVVSGVYAGTATITYSLSTGAIATTAVTVNALPASITGTSNACIGSASTLSDATSGGTWTSNDATIASINATTGVVSPLSAGTTTITYTSTVGCSVVTSFTANPNPSVIAGICVVNPAFTVTLSDSASGGTWSSSDPTVATIGSTGVVTGVTPGTTTITYQLSTGCLATKVVTVTSASLAIIGPTNVCMGTPNTLTDGISGGTWSSSDPSIATVGSTTGIVNGITLGTAMITYTVDSNMAIVTVTVNPVPAPIVGSTPLCPQVTTTFTDPTPGGVWSSSDVTLATVGSTGSVRGVTGSSGGLLIVSYTNSVGCAATMAVTINPAPAPIYTPTINVCVGSTLNLSDATPGGTWSSSSITKATIGSLSGVVTGIAVAAPTITYKLTSTGCFSTKQITVSATPAAISGPSALCVGATPAFTDGTTGGAWTSTNTSVANFGSSSGTITGISAGSTVVSYTISSTGCGVAKPVTVNPNPAAISAPSYVCSGGTTTLTDATPGGTWSNSNTRATIGSLSGVVTPVTPGGTVDIYYQLSTGCKSVVTISVNATPSVITGPTDVCEGASISLYDGTPGGIWSSSNTAQATVGSTGVVAGIAAGTPTVSYIVNGCAATKPLNVNITPAAIPTSLAVCAGGTGLMTTVTPGGVWISGNPAVASIGSATGVITGIVNGTAAITYAMSTGCMALASTTVYPYPFAITGSPVACQGATTALFDTWIGGSWSSSDTSIARINALGVVTGVHAGAATISYTLPSGCASTITVTINPLPAPISAVSPNGCVGTTATLSDATPGGLWSNSNTNAVVGSTTGLLLGVTPGPTTVTYTLPTGCRSVFPMIINIPVSSITSGSSGVCEGASIGMYNDDRGGVWSMSNSLARVDTAGVVTGITAGVTVVSYTLPNTCSATKSLTVNPVPPTSTGPTSVCMASTITLHNSYSGGTWSSSNAAVGSVDAATGVVTGLVYGTCTISYTMPGGCSSGYTVTVNPIAFTFTGAATSLCIGGTATLSDATIARAGTWTSSNAAVAPVDSLGTVGALSPGMAIITYSPTTGCLAISTKTVIVNGPPSGIFGPTNVCIGSTITMHDTTSGGYWQNSNTRISIDSTTGVVTGLTVGPSIVRYVILSTGCLVTYSVNVNPLPSVIYGADTVSPGTTTVLNTGTSGGLWSASNGNITIGSTSGFVTGVSLGTTTVTYTVPTGCFITSTVWILPSGGGRSSNGNGTNSTTKDIQEILLYPNPVTGLSINIVATDAGTLYINSVQGKIVSQYQVSKGLTMIQLPPDLASGVYLGTFKDERGITSSIRFVYRKE